MDSVIVLAALLLVALTVAGAFGALRWQARAYDRKEQVLLGQINTLLDRAQYASGRTWTPPPVEDYGEPPDPEARYRRVPIIVEDPETIVDFEAQFAMVPESELA